MLDHQTEIILQAIATIDKDLVKRLDEIEKIQQKIEKKQELTQSEGKALRYGFPDGDPQSHREYHESVIRWRNAKSDFIRELLFTAAKAGGLATGAWLVWGLWQLIKMEVKK